MKYIVQFKDVVGVWRRSILQGITVGGFLHRSCFKSLKAAKNEAAAQARSGPGTKYRAHTFTPQKRGKK